MIRKVLGTAAAFTSAAVVAFAVPAASHPVHHAAGSGAFYVEVAFEDGTGYDAVLTCPGGAGHPRGAEACGQLDDADGRIGSIPRSAGACSMEYRPVTVRAHGVWGSRFQVYRGQFGNYCHAVRDTGGVLFDLAPH
ncbi:hypothetical protein GCM10027447_22140 [Glycomyces halotolerans]